ncbi:MAG: SIMPL domain-containing protein [Boseongicola sp.]
MRILPIFAFVLALGANAVFAEERAREIVVTGEGIASAAPDMATIRIGVAREARLAGDALRMTSDAMTAVLALLENAGIATRDVQTTNVSLNPRYQRTNDGRPPRVVGYIASNDLMVRVRDLEKLGGVLDAVVSKGANAMNGIFFAVADPAPHETEARRAAVADALAKAEVLAAAAGVALGPVMSIREGGAAPMPGPVMRSMAMEESAVPIAGGEIDIRSQVTIVFAIGE